MTLIPCLLAVVAATPTGEVPRLSTDRQAPESAGPKNDLRSLHGALGRNHPVSYIENRGQWPSNVRFVARMADMLVRAERDAIVLNMPEPFGDPELQMLSNQRRPRLYVIASDLHGP